MNVFDTAGAHTICDLVASRIRKDGADDSVFRERAVALTGTVVPALVWLRDNKGISLNIEVIRLSIELRWIWRLAMERHFFTAPVPVYTMARTGLFPWNSPIK